MSKIKKKNQYFFPLMKNNISKSDLHMVIKYLNKKNPMLTQSENVLKFEKKWSEWLGVKYSVFVNSGSSANLLSIAVINKLFGKGEIILPPLNWVSDIASTMLYNYKLKFVDINMKNLAMDTDEIIKNINSNTKAIFLTHIQGFNGLTEKLLNYLKKKNIPLIEDVCESHGSFFKNKKLGTYGLMSNFSFYYAHHMSTIEGGMISTNDKSIYELLRMLRSHGMIRENKNIFLKNKYRNNHPDLNENFIFALPSFNVRSTEINAIIGLNQIKRLDRNIYLRNRNHKIFLNNIDKKNFIIDFDLIGSSNYAFNLIIKKPDHAFAKRLMKGMDRSGIEYRRGSSGGGNQLRQPYLMHLFPKNYFLKFPNTDHVHFFGFYIGNYPDLTRENILNLCRIINSIK